MWYLFALDHTAIEMRHKQIVSGALADVYSILEAVLARILVGIPILVFISAGAAAKYHQIPLLFILLFLSQSIL